MCDAIKHRNIAFKPIFSPTERTKTENGIVVGYRQNKHPDGLKNTFLIFLLIFAYKFGYSRQKSYLCAVDRIGVATIRKGKSIALPQFSIIDT